MCFIRFWPYTRQHSYPPNEVGRVEKRALKRVFRGGRDPPRSRLCLVKCQLKAMRSQKSRMPGIAASARNRNQPSNDVYINETFRHRQRMCRAFSPNPISATSKSPSFGFPHLKNPIKIFAARHPWLSLTAQRLFGRFHGKRLQH